MSTNKLTLSPARAGLTLDLLATSCSIYLSAEAGFHLTLAPNSCVNPRSTCLWCLWWRLLQSPPQRPHTILEVTCRLKHFGFARYYIDARTASEEGSRPASAYPPPTPAILGAALPPHRSPTAAYSARLVPRGRPTPPRGGRTPPHTPASWRDPRAALGANRAATLTSGPPAGALGCARPPRSRVVARSARARRSGRARWGRDCGAGGLCAARAGR